MMHWITQHPVKTVTVLQPSSQDVAEEKGNPDNPDIPGRCNVLNALSNLRATIRP